MIEQVAVEGPVAHRVRGDIDGQLLAGFDDHRMLVRLARAGTIDQLEEHAMQMDRMRHHGVVDQGQPQPFTL